MNIYASLWRFFIRYRFVALFGLLYIEESGVPLPLPGDILVMYMGYKLNAGDMSALWALPLTSLAVGLGSSTLYLMALRVGHPLLVKYGRLLHVGPERVDTAERWIKKRGISAIILGRLIPGLRTPTSLVSGLLEIPYHVFISATSISAVIWTLFYFGLGYAVQQGVEDGLLTRKGLLTNLHWLTVIGIAVFFISAAILTWMWNNRRVKSKLNQPSDGTIAT